jgi:hypothetical protein
MKDRVVSGKVLCGTKAQCSDAVTAVCTLLDTTRIQLGIDTGGLHSGSVWGPIFFEIVRATDEQAPQSVRADRTIFGGGVPISNRLLEAPITLVKGVKHVLSIESSCHLSTLAASPHFEGLVLAASGGFPSHAYKSFMIALKRTADAQGQELVFGFLGDRDHASVRMAMALQQSFDRYFLGDRAVHLRLLLPPPPESLLNTSPSMLNDPTPARPVKGRVKTGGSLGDVAAAAVCALYFDVHMTPHLRSQLYEIAATDRKMEAEAVTEALGVDAVHRYVMRQMAAPAHEAEAAGLAAEQAFMCELNARTTSRRAAAAAAADAADAGGGGASKRSRSDASDSSSHSDGAPSDSSNSDWPPRTGPEGQAMDREGPGVGDQHAADWVCQSLPFRGH